MQAKYGWFVRIVQLMGSSWAVNAIDRPPALDLNGGDGQAQLPLQGT